MIPSNTLIRRRNVNPEQIVQYISLEKICKELQKSNNQGRRYCIYFEQKLTKATISIIKLYGYYVEYHYDRAKFTHSYLIRW